VSTRRPRVGFRWGSLGGGPVRVGGRHYRLVVFPPGTDDRERWLLRVWRGWPVVGALLTLVAVAQLGGTVGLPLALVLAGTLFLGPFLWLRHTLRRQRRDLVVVDAEFLFGPGTAADLARCKHVVKLSSRLIDAERALDDGALTLLDFQRIWGDVHAEARGLQPVGRAA
jgi:hypothetical protein